MPSILTFLRGNGLAFGPLANVHTVSAMAGETPNPSVALEEYYYFTLTVDCNDSGDADAGDLISGTICNRAIDCSCNGVVDVCDVTEGVLPDADEDGVPDKCEAMCECDWNGDSVLNSNDFFAFTTCFFGGC